MPNIRKGVTKSCGAHVYNHPMKQSFEIRKCINPACGLRYPLEKNHPFGTRCPHCLGETQPVLEREFSSESTPKEKSLPGISIAVILDNIRSGWNAGSILRSADGFGFTHGYFCGITPTPEQSSVKKTSLGAENFVSWSYHKDAELLIRELKAAGWQILILEEYSYARPVNHIEMDPAQKYALVVGNEVTGVDPGLMEFADEICVIPMKGGKRSFNVANAFSIAAYALLNDR